MLDRLVPMTVDAKVRDGLVTLTGTAQWQYQRDEAEFLTASVPGVSGIENDITLTSTPDGRDIQHDIRLWGNLWGAVTFGGICQFSRAILLEPIFEADFQPCSYGFRPNRRAHDAIAEIHYLASRPRDYHWILEADIRSCFDEIGHVALMDRFRRRIKDRKSRAGQGVPQSRGHDGRRRCGREPHQHPQGGILSPLLANIALSALDDHFTRQWQTQMGTQVQRAKRKRHGLGDWRLVRFADNLSSW